MPPRVGNPARRRRHFIAEWRESHDMSQEALADAIGSTKATISRLENLKQGYTQDLLEAVSDALGVHPSVLLQRPPPKDAQQGKMPPSADRARPTRRPN